MRNLVKPLLVALVATNASSAIAQPACDDLGGGVIFRDMLYGLGTGVVITTLGMAVQQDYAMADQKVALGGLVGSGFGLGVGLFEFGTRECRPQAGQFSVQPTYFSDQGPAVSVSFGL